MLCVVLDSGEKGVQRASGGLGTRMKESSKQDRFVSDFKDGGPSAGSTQSQKSGASAYFRLFNLDPKKLSCTSSHLFTITINITTLLYTQLHASHGTDRCIRHQHGAKNGEAEEHLVHGR